MVNNEYTGTGTDRVLYNRLRRRRSSSTFHAAISMIIAIGGAAIVAGVATFTASGQQNSQKDQTAANSPHSTTVVNIPNWALVTLLAIAGVLAGAIVLYFLQKYQSGRLEAQRLAEIQNRELEAMDSALDRLRERMTLPSLVELNRLMLDKYHGIATEQANSSYVSSKRAMWAGFTWLLVCSIAGATVAATTGEKVVLVSLAAIGGALAAFLSRTYIRVYERSLEQLNQYFSQPLLNSYYLTAERLISEMSAEAQDQARMKLLEQLLDGSGAIILGNGDSSAGRGRSWKVGKVRNAREKAHATNGETTVGRERAQDATS